MIWKAVSIIILAIVSVSLLGACGTRSETAVQEPTPEGETPVSQQQEAGTTTDPAQKPSGQRIGGGMLVRLGADPPTLDPHRTTDATSATYIVEVFGGLVTIDSADPDLNIVPDLAKSLPEVSPDGRVYTFRLREDAKFHNGKPVTAHDFKWSFERVSNPFTAAPVVNEYLGDIVGVKDKLRGRATELKGVRVVDNHTLEITIDAPKSYFLAKLTYPTAFVLDRVNVEDGGSLWFQSPNGTGPFKLADYKPLDRLVLERNENYHLGPPFLERVEFILSGGTSMIMYENDEIQITGVGLADLERVKDPSNPLNSELHRAKPTFSTDYIGMKVDVPPFDDRKVRQALNFAIDREEIARVVLAGLVVPAKGILPPGFPAYSDDLEGYRYDPDKAKRLLSESKYGPNLEKFDKTIILTTAGSFGSSVGLDLEIIKQMWKDHLGIDVEIIQTDFATYLQDLIKRRFEMFQIGWIADYPDPENFLDLLFHSESNNNHTAFNNLELNELLTRARVEQNEDARYELYRQAEQLIVDEAPWIPLWHSGEQFVLIKPNVHDYFLTPLIIPKLRFVYMTE